MQILYYVYGIFSHRGNCIYVGSTMDPKKRWKQHKAKGRRGTMRIFRKTKYAFQAHAWELELIAKYWARGKAKLNLAKRAGCGPMSGNGCMIVDGPKFDSYAALARHVGCSTANVSRVLKSSPAVIYPNGEPIHICKA